MVVRVQESNQEGDWGHGNRGRREDPVLSLWIPESIFPSEDPVHVFTFLLRTSFLLVKVHLEYSPLIGSYRKCSLCLFLRHRYI